MEGQALMQRLPEALQQFRVRDTSRRLIAGCGGLGSQGGAHMLTQPASCGLL